MNKIKIFSLGGLNENGKNMYIVEVDEDIFVFDAGLKHPEGGQLGIDYIIPNFDYLKENKERIKGIFITHAHEAHIGALTDILLELENVPVFATPFNIDIIKEELEKESVKANLITITPHVKIEFGKNSIFPIRVNHSIPNSVMYVLNTEDGAIVYTGNFMFDPMMMDSYKMDIGKIAYVGKQGVLCLLAESLAASKIGFTSPNHRISKIVQEIFSKSNKRIMFNIFKGQIYHIQELLDQVMLTDKKVIIMGKTLESTIKKAIDEKYINFDKSRFEDINNCNIDNVVIIIADERENSFSNINRIINGYDKFIKLREDDLIVFTSPVYPGMEKSASRVYDAIARIGSEIMIIPTNKHLSLHASSEDLMLMINLLNPRYYFPVIGEYKEQVENRNCAIKAGMKEENILLKLNGSVVKIENKNLKNTDEVVLTDEILIDGKTVGDIGEAVIKDREILGDNGVVIVSITLDRNTKKLLIKPEVYTKGFIYIEKDEKLLEKTKEETIKVLNNNIKSNYVEFNKLKLEIRKELSKLFYKETECNPMILLLITEI